MKYGKNSRRGGSYGEGHSRTNNARNARVANPNPRTKKQYKGQPKV